MPIQYQVDGATLITPGAYASFKVVAQPSGTPTTGVVTLIGEGTLKFVTESDRPKQNFIRLKKRCVRTKT